MARDKLTEYSATASENTVCGDVNIAENSALPSDMNNFAREVMSHLKAFSDGTDAIDALTVDRGTSDGTIIDVQRGGSSIGAIGTTSTKITVGGTVSGDSHLRFGQTSGVPTIQPADNSGALSDNTVSLGQSGYRFKDLFLGGGLYIGGTGSANKLEDYEEGTWTPEIRNADNDNTFTTESGRYIKIGAVVVAYFVNDGGNTGGGGGLQVRGLPFNSTNTAHIFGARGTAAVNNSSSSTRRNLIVNFNSGNSNSALLYYGGDFLSDTLTYVSGFIIYQTDS